MVERYARYHSKTLSLLNHWEAISGADENLLLLVGFKTTALIIFLLPNCIPIVTYDLTRLFTLAARFA